MASHKLMLTPASSVNIITLFDNYQHNPALKTGWGFSCLVRADDNSILFDTGGDSRTLFYNMDKLGIGIEEIDTIVLSHNHGDHTGGLEGILLKNPHVVVYIPASFPDIYRKFIKSAGADYVDVRYSLKITDSAGSTGELGAWIKEQSLIVNTRKGLVVITGCAHPGIVKIIEEAKKLTGQSIYLAVGGFHLGGASETDLMEIIKKLKELGVEKVAPCHCSGDRTRLLFEREYDNNYINNGVGKIIRI